MSSHNHPSSNMTRNSLIARATQRDAQAWRELVELYGPLIGYWCRRYGLDSHWAADCVQEVFTAVATGLHDFQHPKTSGAFRGWLWTITRNKIRDHQRRMTRQPPATGGSTAMRWFHAAADSQSLPEDDPTDDVQWNQLVRRALVQVQAEFEPRSWHAFWRSTIDGIPTAAVATELNVTAASIRQSCSRILRRLRQQLGDRP